MKSDFFIDRPVFSAVLSALIVIVGVIGLVQLPVDQYPQIVPPVVTVSASYPGASATAVAQAVATPIEQELNGTPGMLYMESTNSNSGSFSATLTFDIKTDPDIAAVEVQNRVKEAEARLPAEVVQNGISVQKQASSRLMTVTILSDDEKFDEIYLSNFATLNVLDMLRRVPGVGRVSNVGSRYYAMQIWVQPDKLAALGLTVQDLQKALKDQNRESAAGVLGQQPIDGVDISVPITATGRLSSVSQFENIVIRASDDGAIIRLKDVARVSLEAHECLYASWGECNGGRQEREGYDGGDKCQFPGGDFIQYPFRYDHLYIGIHTSCLQDSFRGSAAGDSGGLPVPAELEGDPDSGDSGPDIPDRDIRGHACVRVLPEYDDSARAHPCDRYRGG